MSILTFEAIEKAYGRTVALRGVSYRKENKVVVLRASTDADLLAWWEIVAALVVLGGSTWVGLRLGARLFRVGLLSSGARPSLREIIRQARLAD